MKRVVHKITYTILTLFLFCALLAVDFVSTAKSVLSVSAEEESQVVNFDETDISNDLKDLDITEYPKNEKGKHEVVLFMEYCYSVRPFLAENYGLYLYVYNPTEKAVKTASTNNVANMATAYNAKGEPSAYSNVPLVCLDKTENNRFYKFKVMDSASFLTRAKSYATAHDGKRRYDVAGVQIVYADGTLGALESKDEKVAKTYYYTGFAAGCGNEDNAESTLKCEFEKLDTIELEVHSTNYRTGEYETNHRYDLTSVYFAVPNRFFEEYGSLQKIKAEWYEYQTTPICITSNNSVYDLLYPYLGKLTSESTDNPLQLYTGYQQLTGSNGHYDKYDWAYNCDYTSAINESCKRISYLFHTNGAAIGDYVVSSEQIKNYVESYDKSFTDGYIDIAGKTLSHDLFEKSLASDRAAVSYVGDDIHHKLFEFDADDTFDLLNYDETHSGWYKFFAKLFGLAPSEIDQSYKGISPIHIVTEEEMAENNISKTLLISNSENKLEEFRDFYEKATSQKEDKTVVLFRFAQTDYMTLPVIAYNRSTGTNLSKSYGADTYVVQESVFLNFDIIQLTFRKNGVDTVIPVVAAPLNIFNEIELPPSNCSCIPFISVKCNYDDKCECFGLGCQKWRIVAGAIGIIILFPLLYIITFPIRLLFRGANSLAKSERKTRKRK